MRRQGMAQNEIARALGMSASRVSADLKAAFSRLADEVKMEQSSYARLELARLDAISAAVAPGVAAGDTKSCLVAIRASDSRRRLLGLDAALRVEVSPGVKPEHLEAEILKKLNDLPDQNVVFLGEPKRDRFKPPAPEEAISTNGETSAT